MPTYHVPPEIADADLLHYQANRRRVVLIAGGCATYTLGLKGGHGAIVCLCCGLGSVHPTDVTEKFCGFCRCWHSEWTPGEGTP